MISIEDTRCCLYKVICPWPIAYYKRIQMRSDSHISCIAWREFEPCNDFKWCTAPPWMQQAVSITTSLYSCSSRGYKCRDFLSFFLYSTREQGSITRMTVERALLASFVAAAADMGISDVLLFWINLMMRKLLLLMTPSSHSNTESVLSTN